MKRLRATRCGGQLLHAYQSSIIPRRPFIQCTTRQQSSSSAAAEIIEEDFVEAGLKPLPSPPIEQAHKSSKLAALHARLALSKKLPLETLARSLVNQSADGNANFNNSSLAVLGVSIINYHILEYLVCKWPRLPMAILYESLRAYAGYDSMHQIGRRWGVEAVASPGEEVDPGLLQWTAPPRPGMLDPDLSSLRSPNARRWMSRRVVQDSSPSEMISTEEAEDAGHGLQAEKKAYSTFVQALVGSVYAHCGREAAKSFVTSHVLSRNLDPSNLFAFQLPTRELALLCAREGFEAPIARLESETGRRSRTPVFVVGIYSGKEKLGEGQGASLDAARRTASMSALKSWYLYSPGNKVRVPSDMMEEGVKQWTPPHIDCGEII